MANENRYYLYPFADSGARTEVPDTSVGGAVGYNIGYGSDYGLAQGDPNRRRIERPEYNSVMYGITKNLKQHQERNYPTWISDTGSGSQFSYDEGIVVDHTGGLWISLEDSNTDEPSGASSKWESFKPFLLSQNYAALVNARWDSQTTFLAGTITVGSDGNQYKAVVDVTGVDPTTVINRTQWVQYPYEEGSNSNGTYRIHHDDSIEQWGRTPNSDPSGFTTVTLPIQMPSNGYHVSLTDRTAQASSLNAVAIFGFVFDTPTTTTFQARGTRSDGSAADGDSATFYVRG